MDSESEQHLEIWRREIATLLVKEDGEYLPLTSFARTKLCTVLAFNPGTRCLVVRIPQNPQRSDKYIVLKYVPRHDGVTLWLRWDNQDNYRDRRRDMEREVELLEDLIHPNFAEYYAPVYLSDAVKLYGEGAQPIGYLMEYCEGGELGSGDTPYSLDELWACTEWLTSVLADLHEHDILHLDIKGPNILFKGGTLRLIDFGLATHRNISEGFGTPEYLPPEEVNERTRPSKRRQYDIYAMCLTLLFDVFLSGRRSETFEQALQDCEKSGLRDQRSREERIKLIRQAVEEALVDHPTFTPLVRLVLRGIDPKPALRWDSAVALRQAIAAL